MTEHNAEGRVIPEEAPVAPPRVAPRPPRARSAPAAEARAPEPKTGRSMKLESLDAYYGTNHAIKDVSLSYAANEVTAMIGPSGCGKSTVLRCLNRMHEELPGARAEGKVTLDEVEIYGDGIDVTVDLATIDAYKTRLAAWKAGFADLAAKRRASYVDLSSDTNLADLMFAELRRRRVLG